MPLAYAIGGMVNVTSGPVTGRGVPPPSFKGQLAQSYYDISQTPPLEYVFNGQTWVAAGAGSLLLTATPSDSKATIISTGTATLILGKVTIANTNIATGDLIFISRIAANGSQTLGELNYKINNGVSFTINSLMIASTSFVQTLDVSSVAYFIVRPV